MKVEKGLSFPVEEKCYPDKMFEKICLYLLQSLIK